MFRSRNSALRQRLLGGLISILFASFGSVHAGSAPLTVNGAGATFPYPVYSKWFDAYTKVDDAVRFNYQSIGSGGGQKQIIDQTVDFGASDSPMSDASLGRAAGRLLHIPTVAGAVAVTYNVPGLKRLRLDGETLAGIYLGRITRWDDATIVTLNSGVRLPSMNIAVIHRSDGAGTTYVFTDYLSAVSADWKVKAGRNTALKWPVGIGAKGNEGVAGQVEHLPGSIGYVELIYAQQNKMAIVDLKNRAGEFITPSVDSVAAALGAADLPDDFRFSIVNPDAAGAYPIAGVTWLLVYEKQRNPAKGKKLVEFLKWMLTRGDQIARELSYAPLPDGLAKRVLARVETIQF
jgi:phosphate transport system substrate-binding protein